MASRSSRQPCWVCHWFGYYSPSGQVAACLDVRGPAYRVFPEHGCCSWQPERDPAEEAPTEYPTKAVVKEFHAHRDRLQRIYDQANGGKQPFEAHRYVRDISGKLDPPDENARRYGLPAGTCECCSGRPKWPPQGDST